MCICAIHEFSFSVTGMKGAVWHFGEWVYLLSCCEFDEKIKNSLICVCTTVAEIYNQLVQARNDLEVSTALI